jgi:predicted RND superfamily exporter protein
LIKKQNFYVGLAFDSTLRIQLTAVTLTNEYMYAREKHTLMAEIAHDFEVFAKQNQLNPHFSGVPFLRSYITKQLPKELGLFMALAIVLTALALFTFYRSFYAVIFPMLLVIVCSVYSLGIIGLLGYKLTMLTALLPPIIVILSIPPCIYMLSEYHEEYVKTGDKLTAIRLMVHKLGIVTLMINANTALGFLTLYFTNITILKEFGLVAFISTMVAYFITITLIPGVFSLLPDPTEKNLHHLELGPIYRIVQFLDGFVYRRKVLIFIFSALLLVVAFWGFTKLKAVSYMADDLPEDADVVVDLKYMERQFGGIMPFEIVIDARRPGAFQKYRNLEKLDRLQKRLDSIPELSRSVSLADVSRWGRQALYNGNADYYSFPTRDEADFIGLYAQNSKLNNNQSSNILSTLVDSTYRMARISCYVKDLGSEQTPILIQKVQAAINQEFQTEKTPVQAYITGATQIFLKANDYLIENLTWSLVAVFILIGLQMYWLFGSARIMLISMIPNLIPLALTAGVMGFAGIPLKPSTALIYELAFGIAIDTSIHYLAMYRHRRKAGMSIPDAVSAASRSTGMSIIYTSTVLFLGFVIFSVSAFGSTQALGLLTSVTLFLAMFANLLLLPALLLAFDKEKEPIEEAPIDDDEVEDHAFA